MIMKKYSIILLSVLITSLVGCATIETSFNRIDETIYAMVSDTNNDTIYLVGKHSDYILTLCGYFKKKEKQRKADCLNYTKQIFQYNLDKQSIHTDMVWEIQKGAINNIVGYVYLVLPPDLALTKQQIDSLSLRKDTVNSDVLARINQTTGKNYPEKQRFWKVSFGGAGQVVNLSNRQQILDRYSLKKPIKMDAMETTYGKESFFSAVAKTAVLTVVAPIGATAIIAVGMVASPLLINVESK